MNSDCKDDSDLDDLCGGPKQLKTLASNTRFPEGNNLLHQFVLDNSIIDYPNRENYIKAVLLSFPSDHDVNAFNHYYGYSALHLAVLKKDILMVKKLLSCLVGIDINRACFHNGNSALHLAAKLNHLAIIEELVKQGADLRRNNARGLVALDFAAELRNFDAMKLLLNKAAESNYKSGFGHSVLKAAENCDLEVVKCLIENGADDTALSSWNETVLHVAARYNTLDTIKYLVRNGANINAVDKGGLTPLHSAVRSKSLAAVEYLVSNGADLTKSGWAALNIAARIGCEDIIKYLMEKGINHFAKSDSKYFIQKNNILFNLAKSGPIGPNLETIEFLLHKGEVITIRSDATTLLHQVAQSKSLAAVKFIAAKIPNLNVRDIHRRTPLHYAAYQGEIEIIDFLVTRGADVNALDIDGYSPIKNAIYSGSLKVVKYLLDNGYDLEGLNGFGDGFGASGTPLHLAVCCNNYEIVKFLLMRGAEVNAKDTHGKTPLYLAYRKKSNVTKLLVEKGAALQRETLSHDLTQSPLEEAERLLNAGHNLSTALAHLQHSNGISILHEGTFHESLFLIKTLMREMPVDVNARDEYGDTPLHYSLDRLLHSPSILSREVCESLLENNADVNIKNKMGQTPLSIVMRSSHTKTIRLFATKASALKNVKDEYGITPLCYAINSARPPITFWKRIINLFLEKGADVNARNEDGTTALSWAIALGNLEIIELILDSGADLTAEYYYGDTILHSVCESPEVSLCIVELLLRKGCYVNAENEHGKTPLHSAVSGKHPDCIRLLLENGASVNAADIDGFTPLHVAAQKAHPDIIRMLLDKGADISLRSKLGKTPIDLASEANNEIAINVLQRAK